ncbi:MAG: hypothetical protein JXQ71_09205 [Verrucomicrobia bacterium]|nr:hypothetical protein [Verrucomicrobiota bacterium]
MMTQYLITLSALALMGGGLAQAADAPPAAPPSKAAPAVQAQPGARPAPAVQVKPAPPGKRPVMRDRTDFLASYLQLSDAQKEKVRPIFEEESKKIAELRKETKMPNDQRRAKYAEIREATNAKLKAVLTDAQWEKYSKRGQRPATLPPGAKPVRPAK